MKWKLCVSFLFMVLLTTSVNCDEDYEDSKESKPEDTEKVDEEPIGTQKVKNDELKVFSHLCSFDMPLINHTRAEDDDYCNCDVENLAPVGKPVVKIDCELSDGVTNLTNERFHAEKLPLNTAYLKLSFQQFTEIPDFIGDKLQHLDMSNNQITIVKNLNFIHVTSLEHLDLSYNNISDVQGNAFSLLQFLHYLDLSGNQIKVFAGNVFAPLSSLQTLMLSENNGLGKSLFDDVTNKSLTELYLHLGATPKLKSLTMERCNLTRINLFHGVGLSVLNLAHNNISNFEHLNLPSQLHTLELSGNPIIHFTAKSLPHLYLLEVLILEDMPYLNSLDEYSLFGTPRLRHLNLQGSKNLSNIDEYAFGKNVVANETDLELEVVNLRGCNLRFLNSSLAIAFDRVTEFNLDGNPFNCDCDVKWIKDLDIETHLQCNKPNNLNGMLLSEIHDKKLYCSGSMQKLINSLILLGLLIICSLAIWFFIMQLRPSRKKMLQKVGPESPYQRVTIEPNRAEYSIY